MRGTDIKALIREQVVFGSADGTRILMSGPFVHLARQVTLQLALVLHELATNARKYGALSVPTGQLSIGWKLQSAPAGGELFLDWKESGVPRVQAPAALGFGTTLIQRSIESSGGEAIIRYGSDGMTCSIRFPLLDDDVMAATLGEYVRPEPGRSSEPPAGSANIRGKRILVIEDEPLVAMDIQDQLMSAGCQVIGPVGTIDAAKKLIEQGGFDAALLDANLVGRPVDELAALLTKMNFPFAFATGYGREALPASFGHARILIKRFSERELLAEIGALVGREQRLGDVTTLRRS